MAEPPQSRLQGSLQAAVQTVHWTYSLFWQLCPQQGILVWSDGYYNGAIKTRKTVQATEESAEEATLQRSQQLRELYESLSAGETSQQARRPSASLSPEDLTESEWYYLMCVSFSFPLGVGLPGKAYVDRQHIWLTRASEADSKLFSRTILAKSAKIQTVVCIPLLDGVVEIGTTERVEEDNGVIQCVKSFFTECPNPNPPRPVLSEHSTSNPAPGFYSPTFVPPQKEEEEEEEEEEEDEAVSDSDRLEPLTRPRNTAEPMQLDMSDQDIRVGSPDDSSNNLDSDFHLLAVSHHGNSSDHHGHGGLDVGTLHSWPSKHPIISTTLQQPHSVDAVAEEDTHYSQTVSSILENQSNRWSKFSSSTVMSTATSAFSKWFATPTSFSSYRHNLLLDGAAQWVLKYILFTAPLLQAKPRDAAARRGSTLPDELNGNHVLAERRRREKLNERFIILRSMVPFVTKMDKASILSDTIEYLKQLKKRILELESTARQMQGEKSGNVKEIRAAPTMAREKRKMRMVEDGGGGKGKVRESPPQVEVSIIESDALVEIQCMHRGGLLLDVMLVLGGLGIQVTTVQSSIHNATFIAELRAKVKENANGRKPSIMEVKRTIKQIIQHH